MIAYAPPGEDSANLLVGLKSTILFTLKPAAFYGKLMFVKGGNEPDAAG
jgi:hypothetical protein